MTWILDCWRSSIGSKITMAVTGILLFSFVVGHLIGNLQLFSGADKINAYAHMLQGLGPLLWLVRLGLLSIFVLHVVTGVRLARANRLARPVAYSKEATIQASFASRSMVLTGLSLLAFVVYHLLHFTIGVTNPEHMGHTAILNGHEVHDVYAMVTQSFGVPVIAIAYAAFQVVLFFHLSHGIQSFAHTVGLHHARYTPMIKKLSFLFAAIVAGGNILLALSVLLGLVKGVA
ncbi:MAG: succinate dehydrogenase cytochrome b subunit [Planctomycetes bacterium]|nr:succinate dehydrogenase cytochrome b subunit [Planctomycetota bacterium]